MLNVFGSFLGLLAGSALCRACRQLVGVCGRGGPRQAGLRLTSLLAAVLLAGCSKEGDKKGASRAGPPAAVTVADVAKKALPVEIRTFGTVEASATVAVRAQIGGLLTNLHFREGQDVKQGDLLFSIDSRPAEAALKQAEANLARDTVLQKNAESEAGRQEELLKKGLTSQDIRDQARTAADALAAAVRADQAGVDNARLELAYCSIQAPINGRTGRLMADPGNVVKANDTVLLTLNRIKPVYVSFAVPQGQLPAIQPRMAAEALPLRVFIPGGADQPETGALTFVDNAVDPRTGTVLLRGAFTNDNLRLWPGQFVNVVLTLAVQTEAVVIPSAAVQAGQKGVHVFVVKADMTAESRPITVQRTFDDETVVASGLAPGERVVTDGQLRLGPGVTVEIKSAAPKPSVAPP